MGFTITKWTKSRAIYYRNHKNRKYRRGTMGHNVNVGQNNDIYGKITLSLLVGNFFGENFIF